MGCIKASTIEYKNSEVLYRIDLWDLSLQKLVEILIPSNPPDDNKNGVGSINTEENKKDGEKSLSVTECCLHKIEKVAIPTRVVLLQSTNIVTWEHLYILQTTDVEVVIYEKVVSQVP